MNRYHYAAEKWNRILEVTNGEQIAAALAYYWGQPPRLAPPVDGLADKLGQALAEIFPEPAGITVISARQTDQAIEGLKNALPVAVWQNNLREGLEEAIVNTIQAYVGTDLWFELKASSVLDGLQMRLGERRWGCVEQGVWSSLLATPWASFQNCFSDNLLGQIYRHRTRKNFESLLCYQVALLALSADEKLARGERLEEKLNTVGSYLELFRAGNFPIGRLDDTTYTGAFLILVE